MHVMSGDVPTTFILFSPESFFKQKKKKKKIKEV